MVNKKLIITAVLLSFLSTMSIFFYLKKVESRATDKTYRKVVVAKLDIPAKTTVTSEMVQIKGVPQDFVHEAAMTKVEEVVGQISAGNIYAGEQIITKKIITAKDNDKGLAYVIPAGKRAVSVPVNDVSGVAGLIKPGDQVDITATLDLDGQNIGRVVQTSFVLQKILVLAVNKNLEENGTNITGNEKQQTVTLALTPEQAPSLIIASEKGSIRLLLRNHTDEETKNITPHRLSNFLREGE